MSLTPNLNHALGYTIPSIRAPQLALDFVRRIIERVCGGSKFVTITLRETSYDVERNSDENLWRSVSEHFRKNGYRVLLLPDYERVFETPDGYFEGAYTCRECVLDLRLRFALYELASLNLGQVGGPTACLCYDDACKYLISGLITEDNSLANQDYRRGMGFDIGKDNGYFETYNKWLWTREDEREILRICDRFIDADSTSGELESLVNPASPIAAFEAIETHFGPDVSKAFFSKMGRSAPIFVNKEYNIAGEHENTPRYVPSLKT